MIGEFRGERRRNESDALPYGGVERRHGERRSSMPDVTDVYEVHARMDTHEAVCAERYGTIIGRVDRMETILMRASGILITTLVGILITMLIK